MYWFQGYPQSNETEEYWVRNDPIGIRLPEEKAKRKWFEMLVNWWIVALYEIRKSKTKLWLCKKKKKFKLHRVLLFPRRIKMSQNYCS